MSAWPRSTVRALCVVLVTVAAMGCGLMGCGEDEPMFEREDEIQEVVDGLGAALGVDDINADVHHRETEPGCAANLGLDEDEAWYERNTFSIPPQPDGQTRLYPATVTYFDGAEFAVDELLAPLSGSRGVRAVRDDLTVVMDFVGDGANLTVTAGPCAVDLSPVPDRYEVVEP